MSILKKRASIVNSTTRKNADKRWSAVESLEQRVLLTSVVVNTPVDALFPPTSGMVSLRNAIATANASASPTTITFSASAFAAPQTIVLNGTELDLTNPSEPTTIIGAPAGVTVSGNNQSTVFVVEQNVTVNLSKLTITEGNSGVVNSGTLTLVGITLTGNDSGSRGGGLYNFGNATLINTTITGNSAGNFGGGIDNGASGNVSLSDVDITDNSATFAGGVTNDAAAASFAVYNTIIAGNTGGSLDLRGNFDSLGYNIVGAADGGTGFNVLDLTGTAAHPFNPKLGKLSNNGGPTETMLPLPGSPAIGAGLVAYVPKGITTDQRGLPRIINGKVDIGAVEVQPTTVVSITLKAPAAQTATVGQSKSFPLGSFTQSGATAPFKATVKWGDGSANSTVAISAAGTIPATAHTFAKAGAFTVTVSVADSASHVSNSVTFKVTVTPVVVATGSISGEVFNDGNGDGKLDGGEYGSGLWTVDLSSGGKLLATAITNINGDFSFTKLTAGTYLVKVVQVAGTKATRPTSGTMTLTLTAGEASIGNLFGEAAIA